MSIGVAIVGGGIFAKNEHLPALLALPDKVTVKAVYSRSLKSCASLTEDLATKVDFYSDETAEQGAGYRDLLDRTDIKAVVIALPIMTQPEFVRLALSAGKHVLSEKPIAATHAIGQEMVDSHFSSPALIGEHSSTGAGKASWVVGENWRVLESHQFAAAAVARLGRLLHFHVHSDTLVSGGKYFETAWRKVPEYQGGFVLDGGIHHIAALRYILGSENAVTKVSAFTKQVQEHLPPVDTVSATLLTEQGAPGTFSLAYGSTMPRGHQYAFACDKGSVTMTRGKVTVVENGKETITDFPDEGMGVKLEIAAWIEGIERGVQQPRLSPVEALKDLELLEAMLRSGERSGAGIEIKPNLHIEA